MYSNGKMVRLSEEGICEPLTALPFGKFEAMKSQKATTPNPCMTYAKVSFLGGRVLGESATRSLPSPKWVVTSNPVHNSNGVQLFVDFEGRGVGSDPGGRTGVVGAAGVVAKFANTKVLSVKEGQVSSPRDLHTFLQSVRIQRPPWQGDE